MRYVDRVAYLAADLQDAKELGISSQKDIPKGVRKRLGEDVGEMIGRVTQDLVRESRDKDYVSTSEILFEALLELYKFSSEHIYQCELIKKQKERLQTMVKDLFDKFLEVVSQTKGGKDKKLRNRNRTQAGTIFFKFLDNMEYGEKEPAERIVLDFVAGMTDNFLIDCYQELFPLGTPVAPVFMP